jgi:glycerol-3-phosphate dehydrogenase
MGSTDIRVDNPDDAECQDDEVDYMMTTLKGVFPDLNISKDDIVFTFCGVRPLPASGLDYTSRVPRAHRTEVSESDEQRSFRIYSMIGGKLTTFGAFSEQTAGMILTHLGRERIVCTAERPYLGAGNYPSDELAKKQWIDRVASENNLKGERVSDLLDRYGTEAEMIAAQKDGKEYTPLENLPDYSIGEIEYIVENECIRHLSDLVRRRSVIAITGRASEAVLTELADVVGRVLNWNRQRRQTEVEIALKEVRSRK